MPIKQIGIELEGGWNEVPGPRMGSEHLQDMECPHTGEIDSPPLPVEEAIEWALNYHPDEGKRGCGLHVHVSFTDLREYAALMEPEFFDYFYDQMERWNQSYVISTYGVEIHDRFHKRLRGTNPDGDGSRNSNWPFRLMKRKFEPMRQLYGGAGRYGIAFRAHKGDDGTHTVEFRCPPQTGDPQFTEEVVRKLVDIIESYLERMEHTIENGRASISVGEPAVA